MGGKILGMATIKLQDGKVILKDGKVSCSCCEADCNELFNITDPNVFEITKQKYDQYFSGGTWQLSISLNVNQSASYTGNQALPATQIGSALLQTTLSRVRSGCRHLITINQNLGQYQVTINYSSGNTFTSSGAMPTTATFEIKLKKIGNKYYVKYITSISIDTNLSFISGLRRGFDVLNKTEKYPTQIQSIVDGNNITIYRMGVEPFFILRLPPTPSIPWTSWNETSSATLNATFTPA